MLTERKIWIYIITAFVIGSTYCLRVIPESSKVTYYNEKYLETAGTNVRRYGRNSSYYLNVWGSPLRTWGNNITIHVVLTEYLHNEYRRSFIEGHERLCDSVNNEPYVGGMLKKVLGGCPVSPGPHYLMNMTVPTEDFPNVFPFEKGGADITLTYTDTGEVVATGYMHASAYGSGSWSGEISVAETAARAAVVACTFCVRWWTTTAEAAAIAVASIFWDRYRTTTAA